MKMNGAQLNAAHLSIKWEEMKIRETRLMEMNEAELNASRFKQAETEANFIRGFSDTGRAILMNKMQQINFITDTTKFLET